MLKIAKEYRTKIQDIVDYLINNTELRDIFEESYDIWNGWASDIMLTEAGHIVINEFLSQGSMTMDQWNGTALTIATIEGGREFEDFDENQITWQEYVDIEFEMFCDNLYTVIAQHLDSYINDVANDET